MNKLITTVAALLLALCAMMPATATPHTQAAAPTNAGAKVDGKAATTTKTADAIRYKRIRAKAHRNAARAKAHARALRLADQT